MDKQHENRVIGGSGAGLAVLGIFLPYVWHEMPTWLSYPAILMGSTLLVWGLWPAFNKNVIASKSITEQKTPEPILPKSLEQHFQEDSKLGKYMTELTMTPQEGPPVKVQAHVCMNHDENTKFLSFYIPHCPDPFSICAVLARDYKIALDQATGIQMISRHPGDATHTDSKDLVFSGRIFLYHEDMLSLEQLGTLEGLYKSHSLIAQFRGHDWTTARWMQQSLMKK